VPRPTGLWTDRTRDDLVETSRESLDRSFESLRFPPHVFFRPSGESPRETRKWLARVERIDVPTVFSSCRPPTAAPEPALSVRHYTDGVGAKGNALHAKPLDTPVYPSFKERERAEFVGSLADTSLAEVFRRIVSEERSGDLQVTAEAIKTVYIDRGFIVFASSNRRKDRLGESMVEAGRISRLDLAAASELVKMSRFKFGRALVSSGIVSEEELGHYVAAQVNRIVLSVFSATRGMYSFDERPTAIPMDLRVSLSVDRILMEGIRRMTSRKLVLAGLPSLDGEVEVVDPPPFALDLNALRPVERSVLEAVNNRAAAIRALIKKVGGNDGVVLRALYGLVAAGVLEAKADRPKGPISIQFETGTFVLSEISQKVSAPESPQPAGTRAPRMPEPRRAPTPAEALRVAAPKVPPPLGESVSVPVRELETPDAADGVGVPLWSIRDAPENEPSREGSVGLSVPEWSVADNPADQFRDFFEQQGVALLSAKESREAPPPDTHVDERRLSASYDVPSIEGNALALPDPDLPGARPEDDGPSMFAPIPIEEVAIDEKSVSLEPEDEVEIVVIVESDFEAPPAATMEKVQSEPGPMRPAALTRAPAPVVRTSASPIADAPVAREAPARAAGSMGTDKEEEKAVSPAQAQSRRRVQVGGEGRLLRDVKLHFKLRDWEGAVPLLEQLIEISPSKALYRGMLGRALSRHPSRRKEAEAQFVEALRLAPRDPEIHYWLGLYYKSFGLGSRAANEFKTAFRIDPQHQGARRQLGASVKSHDARGSMMKRIFG